MYFKRKEKLILGLLLSLFSATSWCGNVEAAEKEETTNTKITSSAVVDEYALDDIVVTASRIAKEDLETPATTTVITGEQLMAEGRTTAFEAMEHVAGVNVFSYGNGGEEYGGMGCRINVRGLDKGTLVMVDGAPMNLNGYNGIINNIPVETIERIEIVKGSNSVLYGSEAMGGVINIITKAPKYGEKTYATVGGEWGGTQSRGYIRVGGDGFTLSGEHEFRRPKEPLSSVYVSSGKYRQVDKENGKKQSYYFNAKLSDNLRFNYFYNKVHSIFDVNVSNTVDMANRSRLLNYDYTSYRQNGNLIYNDDKANFKAVLGYVKDRFIAYRDSSTNTASQALTLDLQKGWNYNKKDSVVVGATFGNEKYNDYKSNKDISRFHYALFASGTSYLSDKFSVTYGVRGHFIKKNDYDKGQNVFLPQLQTNYRFNKTSSWYINVGKSFELPSSSGVMVYSSPYYDLKPQQGWTYETGYKYVGKKDTFKAAIFRMDITDKFAWVYEDDYFGKGRHESVYINQDKYKNTGIELEYSRDLNDKWFAKYTVSISNPKAQEKGVWSQCDAKLQMGFDLRYTLKKFSSELNAFWLGNREPAYYNSQRKSGNPKDRNVPSSFDLSLTFRYKPTKDDTFTCGVYNLLDRDNPINKYEYPAWGRNFRVGYEHTF